MNLITRIRNRLRPIRFLDLIIAHESFIKKHGIQRGAYLEFGTYRGKSALALHNAVSAFYDGEIPPNAYPMYLFDSFEGLPASSNPKDQYPSWKQGVFDVGGVENFINTVTSKGLPRERFECIAGYYEQSLQNYQVPEGLKAAIVNMDCDYYSSTIQALRFLRPYLQDFTLFYFDDLLSFAGHPDKGQIAAIREFNEETPKMGIQPCPIFSGKYEGRIFWSWVDLE